MSNGRIHPRTISRRYYGCGACGRIIDAVLPAGLKGAFLHFTCWKLLRPATERSRGAEAKEESHDAN